jgi:hypothetical protein
MFHTSRRAAIRGLAHRVALALALSTVFLLGVARVITIHHGIAP